MRGKWLGRRRGRSRRWQRDGMGWHGKLGYVREAGVTWGEREGVTELGEKYLEPVQLRPLPL